MFRRFMIVCWTVFFLGIGVIGVGSFGYWVLEDPPTPPPGFELNDYSTAFIAVHGDPRQVWADTIVVGILISGIALLWNIIWHVAHWVWMGRVQK